ncbi:DNA topoisomerase IB [Agromyces seonyuensis]|uniref:DNA topoisomerase IB n=1 Tax=Agromyces seonyuensis TaxID=2662446 RepID=A0A6I4NUZ9_9MICO|nr:DNA topoisomerase IB [Agromyces seonyuensis]MWB98120.1 DNA topoisomerase IB [Agromyces seonyuensis]
MSALELVEPYASPGYSRRRAGRGFAYFDAHGSTVDAAERARVQAIAIPPAWTDVWIALDPHAHILAVGTDEAGRRQYLYHPDWRAQQDAEKFARMLALAGTLSEARRSVTRELRGEGLTHERTLAAAFRTLDLGAIRIGSEEYLAEHRSRGLTTLLVRNATIEHGALRLRYRAKGAKQQDVRLADDDVVAWFRLAGDRGGAARLYAWRDGRRMRALSPAEVNEDVRARTGGDFTAKDFRTLRGTIAAAALLAATGPAESEQAGRAAESAAVEAAAAVLGNTPTIARASYIDPAVFAAYREGRLLRRTGAAERALLELLGAGSA